MTGFTREYSPYSSFTAWKVIVSVHQLGQQLHEVDEATGLLRDATQATVLLSDLSPSRNRSIMHISITSTDIAVTTSSSAPFHAHRESPPLPNLCAASLAVHVLPPIQHR